MGIFQWPNVAQTAYSYEYRTGILAREYEYSYKQEVQVRYSTRTAKCDSRYRYTRGGTVPNQALKS